MDKKVLFETAWRAFEKPFSPLQPIYTPLLARKEIEVSIKRDDCIDPFISGNKWRKLKYNLHEAHLKNKSTLLTFGGAYSNHLYAVSAAGKRFGFKTVGVVRGDEPLQLSPTLAFAKKNQMHLHFVSREEYRHRTEKQYVEAWQNQYPDAYIIPEGGTNKLALLGCAELAQELPSHDFMCVACGTGGTLAGLVQGLAGRAIVFGFPVLKGGEFLHQDIQTLLSTPKVNYDLFTNYHFGGYARSSPDLIDFIRQFEHSHAMLIEQVYTGKMLFGLFDLIQQDYFKKGTKIIALHTGGLQGRDPSI